MNKQLKDYIHHYIGCEVRHFNGEGGKLIGVEMPNSAIVDPSEDATDGAFRRRIWSLEAVNLILRRLSSMTDDQEDYYDSRMDDAYISHDMEAITTIINDLIAEGYDCHGLIDAGLAIDAATLEGGQQS